MIRKVLLEYMSTRASLDKFMHAYYGLSLPRKLWVMGYKGFMGYVGDFPASQLGGWDFLWVMGGYGLREVWVIRVSTVVLYSGKCSPPARLRDFSAPRGLGFTTRFTMAEPSGTGLRCRSSVYL